MLRWFLGKRVPVIQVNERGRFIGFRDPGMASIKDHTGLYVAREPDDADHLWAATTAVREPLEQVERRWRGVRDGYLRAGKADRLDPGAFTAAGFAVL